MVRLNMIPEVRLDFESKKMKGGDVLVKEPNGLKNQTRAIIVFS